MLKWLGLAVCALTLLGCWAWTFSAWPWFPRPHYHGSRWGFTFGRAYLALNYVTITPPYGKTMRDFTATDKRSVEWFISSPYVDGILPGYDAWAYAEWLPTLHKGVIGFPPRFTVMTYRLYLPLITFPLLILIPVGAITGMLWYLDRRRSRPGHCEDCGYDLTGNVGGRCPECGAAVVLPADAEQEQIAG